jgi:hypothetical protein
LKQYADFSGWNFQNGIGFIEDGTLQKDRPLRIVRSQNQVVISYLPTLVFDQASLTPETSNHEIVSLILGKDCAYQEHQSFVMFASSPIPIPPVDGLVIDALRLNRKMDLGKLKSVCTKEEVMSSQVGLEDDLTIGIYHGNDLLAVGSLWYLGDNLADIHLLTHPKFRSIGLGKILLISLVNRAFHLEKMPMVRGNLKDQAAYRVALACGLTEALSNFEIELKAKMADS